MLRVTKEELSTGTVTAYTLDASGLCRFYTSPAKIYLVTRALCLQDGVYLLRSARSPPTHLTTLWFVKVPDDVTHMGKCGTSDVIRLIQGQQAKKRLRASTIGHQGAMPNEGACVFERQYTLSPHPLNSGRRLHRSGLTI